MKRMVLNRMKVFMAEIKLLLPVLLFTLMLPQGCKWGETGKGEIEKESLSKAEKNLGEGKESEKKVAFAKKHIPTSVEDFWENIEEPQYIFESPEKSSTSSSPIKNGAPRMTGYYSMAPPSSGSPPQEVAPPPSSPQFQKAVQVSGLFRENTIERFLPFKDALKLSNLFPSPLKGWKAGEIYLGREVLFWSRITVAMREYRAVSGSGSILFWLLTTEERDLTAMLNPSVMFPEVRSAEERSIKGKRCYLFMDTLSKRYILTLPLLKDVGAYLEGENIASHDILLQYASSIDMKDESFHPISK